MYLLAKELCVLASTATNESRLDHDRRYRTSKQGRILLALRRSQQILRHMFVAFVIAILMFGTACGGNRNFVPLTSLPEPTQNTYRIQVADVLEISFFRTPELTQERTVGPDGEIALTLVGTVRAAGRQVDELSESLNRLYSRDLSDPQITVSVTRFSGLNVYVAGEVNTPGMVPYRGGLTLVGAILNAGGFRNTARLGQVVVIRRDAEGQPFGAKVDVRSILAKAQFEDDIPLAPSDIIFIPRSIIANVNLFIQQYFRDILPVPLFLGFDVGPVRTR